METKLTVLSGGRGANKPHRKLGSDGKQLWRTVTSEYEIEDATGRELLLLACEQLDRAQKLRDRIDSDGEMVRGRNGSVREHPLLKPELLARAFVVRTLNRLGLDAEPVKAPGRPQSKIGPGPVEG